MYIKNAMFNQSQKQKYIDYENSNSDSLRRYFVRIEPKEKEYNKDIADMNVDELENTILHLGIRREGSRGHLLSLLRGYINWAILNQKTQNVKNAIDKITPENTNSEEIIRQTMIKSPEHLQEILDNVLDYTDYKNRSNRDSLVFWLLYCGMDLEEMPILKKDDIDKEIKTIIIENGKRYEADNKILDLWIKCSEMTFLERKNSRSENSKNKNVNEYTKYLLIDNKYLFRPIQGSKSDLTRKCSINTFRSVVAKMFQDRERNIPARNINYSGKFYQIYLLEQQNGNVDPNVFAEKFGIAQTNEGDLLIKTRKWRVDYEDWKMAFGYM